MLKKNHKFTLIFAVLTLLVSTSLLSGCKKDQAETPDEAVFVPEVASTKVTTGLKQEFTITGDVEAHQISRLTSEIRGKVDSILVNEGDPVTKGQTMLKLSSSQVNSSYNTAGNALRNAQVSLQSTQLTSQQNIEAAKIALETAKTSLSNTLKQNISLKAQAEEALSAAKLNTNLGVTAAETALNNAVSSVLPTVQAAVTASDKLLGVSESFKYANDTFENNLGAFDRIGLSEAKKSLRNLLTDVALYTSSYANASDLLKDTETMLQNTLSVLNNSITGDAYSETSLSTDKNSITTQLAAIRASSSALESAADALDSAKQDSNGSSQAVLNAQAAYNATISQLNTAEDSARKAVKSAENALETAKQSAKLSQITAKSTVDNAFGSYDQARINQNKLLIQAPFGGKVSSISVKTGEEVNPGSMLITVEDDSILKLSAYLSPDDVSRISLGDTVTINRNGESAQVTSISPSADPITQKYKVEMLHADSKLRPGEVVRITFSSSEEVFNHGRLFVPLPALHIQPDEVFVWKLKDHKTIKANVTVGEIIGEYVEILTGLSEGDEIISEGGRLIEKEGIKVDVLNQPSPKIPN